MYCQGCRNHSPWDFQSLKVKSNSIQVSESVVEPEPSLIIFDRDRAPGEAAKMVCCADRIVACFLLVGSRACRPHLRLIGVTTTGRHGPMSICFCGERLRKHAARSSWGRSLCKSLVDKNPQPWSKYCIPSGPLRSVGRTFTEVLVGVDATDTGTRVAKPQN